jgi:hypothetical protein
VLRHDVVHANIMYKVNEVLCSDAKSRPKALYTL